MVHCVYIENIKNIKKYRIFSKISRYFPTLIQTAIFTRTVLLLVHMVVGR